MNLTASQITAFFFPPLCLSCKADIPFSEWSFCESCRQKIIPWSRSICRCCGEKLNAEIENSLCGACLKNAPAFNWARAVYKLTPELSKLLYAFKYSGEESALPWMTLEMALYLENNFPNESFDFIVPVPLHWWRLVRRGYNQSLLLAKALAKKRKEKLNFSAFIKSKASQAQSTLSKEERMKQLKGAFQLKEENLFKEKKVLLIDDVYTTGSTLRECASVLKKAGAQVFAFTLARTPLE